VASLESSQWTTYPPDIQASGRRIQEEPEEPGEARSQEEPGGARRQLSIITLGLTLYNNVPASRIRDRLLSFDEIRTLANVVLAKTKNSSNVFKNKHF